MWIVTFTTTCIILLQGCISTESTCTADLFQCLDGGCINRTKICDFDFDCADNTDEKNCTNVDACIEGQFRCDDGTCVTGENCDIKFSSEAASKQQTTAQQEIIDPHTSFSQQAVTATETTTSQPETEDATGLFKSSETPTSSQSVVQITTSSDGSVIPQTTTPLLEEFPDDTYEKETIFLTVFLPAIIIVCAVSVSIQFVIFERRKKANKFLRLEEKSNEQKCNEMNLVEPSFDRITIALSSRSFQQQNALRWSDVSAMDFNKEINELQGTNKF